MTAHLTLLKQGCANSVVGLELSELDRGFTTGWFSKRVVLADVFRERNRKKGTFGCSPERKLEQGYVDVNETGTRVHSLKPPFYETALLSPLDLILWELVPHVREKFRPQF